MNVINRTTARFILLVAVLLFGVSNMSYGVIAYPGPTVVTQPDGSQVTVMGHGDEFFNYNTTVDGYIVARSADGYYHYADYDSGKLRISNARVGKGTSFGKTKSIPEHVQRTLRAEGLKLIDIQSKGRAGAGVYSLAAPVQPKKGLIILVEYPDKHIIVPSPNQTFTNLANQAGYSYNGATGSIADFYEANSMGTYRPDFDVFGPYMMPRNHASYIPESMWNTHAVEAVTAAAADPALNFANYASDGATVDLILIYFAGHNPAEEGYGVWPHKSSLVNQNLIYNGVKIDKYACSSELRGPSGTEISGIGTMSHEFGHVLGLGDVYAVGNRNNTSAISWQYLDLMNSANYNNLGRTPPLFNAYQRHQMGWITLEDIDASGDYTLEPLFTSNKAYRIKTDVDGEFYTIENRNTGTGNKWDVPWGAVTKGMIVYHMDFSTTNMLYNPNYGTISARSAWAVGQPNTVAAHQCADFIEASGSEYYTQTMSTLLFPGSLGVTSLLSNTETKPRLTTWSSTNLGVDLTNIAVSGGNVTFTVKKSAIDFSKAQLSGRIRSVMEVPIVGAEVNVYDATGGASSPSLFSATTDDKGKYSMMNLDVSKSYLIVAKTSALYVTVQTTKTFSKGENIIDLTMVLEDNNPNKNLIQWYGTSNVSTTHGLDGDLYARVKFSPADLSHFAKSQIYSVSVLTSSAATYATLTMTSNRVEVVKDLRVNQSGGGQIVFDLSQLNIRKLNNEELVVTIKTNGKIFVDESTCVRTKSNMMSPDGLDWKEMTYFPPATNGSWIISLSLNEGTGEIITTAPFPAIKLAESYAVGSKFAPALNNATSDIESVTYSVNGTAVSGEYTFATAGSYTIEAKVKYNDASALGVETIVRKISVK